MSEKKFGKRLLTWALVIVMILTVVPLNVLADETDTWAAEGYAAKLDPTAEVFPVAPGNRSKSKTATQLDTSTWTSTVTLSLPSAEEKLANDVVFVMDDSTSANSNARNEALKLLTDLKSSEKESGATINVCVVQFNRKATRSDWFDLSTQITDIETAMDNTSGGGTNIHAGLLAGKEALEEHSNVSVSRKYLILVSDGSTYLYSKDGNWASDTPFTRSYYTKENYEGAAGGFNDQGLYSPSNGGAGYDERNVARPTNTADVAAWQAYLADVKARNETVNGNGKTGDDYDYHCEYDNNFNKGIPSKDFKSQPCEGRTANNRDMTFYYANQVWQQIKETGCNAYSIAVADGSAGAGNSDDSHCFMNYLNDGKTLNFADIENDILYAVSAGSKVEDTIGAAFDLDVKSFELTVGGVPVGGTFDKTANTWSFGDNSTPRFTVEYNRNTKTFTWMIYEDVFNLAPVQLSYTVKLTDPQTAPGTYSVTDLNGDGYDDYTKATVDSKFALYTNGSAKLFPLNSLGSELDPTGEVFPKPSVSYAVSYPYYPIIPPAPTVEIEDDDALGLNTTDHFAYIIGYPDGTFGPQRSITRAETMTLVNRVLDRKPETGDDLLPDMVTWTDNADKKAWYYLAVQEATNSHYYEFKTNSSFEKWTELRENRDWSQLEK